jgi:RNA polymerase-binding transcription factor DksA
LRLGEELMEPGRKTRLTRVGDADSVHVQGLPSGSWQKQKLVLESEKDETSRIYKSELQRTSQLIQQPREQGSPSMDLVRDKKLGCLTALTARLRQIDEALHRIRTGRYGLCTSCGIEICRDRLDRDLTIQYCTLCQSEADLRGGRYAL